MKIVKPESILKQIYVGVARTLTPVAKKTRLLSFLEARSDRRWAHWLRSLAAIHDIDDMIFLDTPWWTYNAIDEVEAFLLSHPTARVLEYGSGASTVWLAKRAGTVKSIEHDPEWYGLVRERINAFANVEIVLREAKETTSANGYASTRDGFEGLNFENYVCEIRSSTKPYDLIIIDGRARSDCLKVAKAHLSQGGIILFDNTFRRRYNDAISDAGGTVRRFSGWAPSLPYRDQTSLISFPATNT